MHFARTEEQDELATIVRGMLDKRSGPEAVRAAMESDAGYDESLWQAMCEQVGVAALPVPEEYDGFGASLVETVAPRGSDPDRDAVVLRGHEPRPGR